MRYIQYLTEVILAWIQMKEGKNLPEKYHHLFETELSEEGVYPSSADYPFVSPFCIFAINNPSGNYRNNQ